MVFSGRPVVWCCLMIAVTVMLSCVHTSGVCVPRAHGPDRMQQLGMRSETREGRGGKGAEPGQSSKE